MALKHSVQRPLEIVKERYQPREWFAAAHSLLAKSEPSGESDFSSIKLDAWLKREIPPRDYLLGHLLCTTSRCLLIGDTGVGKTLFGLEIAGAMASGKGLLGWAGRRRARIIYLDGEMPDETLKERLQLIAGRYGSNLNLWAFNRDVVEMPPLNTEEGPFFFLFSRLALAILLLKLVTMVTISNRQSTAISPSKGKGTCCFCL